MQNAPIDENEARGILAALNTDGVTVIEVLANPVNHGLKVSDGATGSDHGPTHALHDENGVTSWLATSSVDGKTPVVVYADSSGNLLVDSL